MRIGVLGINHKLAHITLREQLAKTCHRRFLPHSSVHGEHHFILLSTCNRTEIYFTSENLAETHSYILGILRQDVSDEFEQKLYSYFGQDCLLHLVRVTTGLDSAILVETEIQGQVKRAYESVQEHHQIPFELHYLFQKALGISKKARAILPTKQGLPGIEHAILNTGQYLFPEMQSPKILFIGASGINEKILAYLKVKQLNHITLCNRTYKNAQTMAETHQIECIPWEDLMFWHDYDWIIFGTKASTHLLHSEHLTCPISRKFIVDLSVPRNVDPKLAKHSQITLLNIDQINRRLNTRKKYLHKTLIQAEELILQSSQQHTLLFQKKEKARAGLCA